MNKNKDTLGYAIGRTNWYLRTLFNKLLKDAGLKITNEQWIVLKIISTTPEISQTEIAERSLKDKTNITRILDVLEKYGYISRLRNENDRRMYKIILTSEGSDILKQIEPIAEKTERTCTEKMSDNEIRDIKKQLNDLCENIRNKI